MTLLSNHRNGKWIIAAGVTLTVGASAALLISKRGGSVASAGAAVPEEFSAAAFKSRVKQGPEAMDAMRDAMRRDDLTDEQRRQIAQNAREAWREQMTAQVDAYFEATTPDDKNAILDTQIDEWAQRMKTFEERRKKFEEEKGNGAPDEARAREMFGSRTQQERKERSESRNPDQAARSMAYFSAMRERAKERGVPIPRGPGSGWGPGSGPGERRGGP